MGFNISKDTERLDEVNKKNEEIVKEEGLKIVCNQGSRDKKRKLDEIYPPILKKETDMSTH